MGRPLSRYGPVFVLVETPPCAVAPFSNLPTSISFFLLLKSFPSFIHDFLFCLISSHCFPLSTSIMSWSLASFAGHHDFDNLSRFLIYCLCRATGKTIFFRVEQVSVCSYTIACSSFSHYFPQTLMLIDGCRVISSLVISADTLQVGTPCRIK